MPKLIVVCVCGQGFLVGQRWNTHLKFNQKIAPENKNPGPKIPRTPKKEAGFYRLPFVPIMAFRGKLSMLNFEDAPLQAFVWWFEAGWMWMLLDMYWKKPSFLIMAEHITFSNQSIFLGDEVIPFVIPKFTWIHTGFSITNRNAHVFVVGSEAAGGGLVWWLSQNTSFGRLSSCITQIDAPPWLDPQFKGITSAIELIDSDSLILASLH